MENLDALLEIIGTDKKEKVILAEVGAILASTEFWSSDAGFLIAVGKVDTAEKYLFKRSAQLNGDYYSSLLPLAKAFLDEGRSLATSLIYRSLLVSILERGYTKAYPYGARYLAKLDEFADEVSDWQRFDSHKAFKEMLLLKNGRKRSFWSKYDAST